jgi:GrpB-like predicted nucleotidyltransferase (UPF0157 family)
MSTEAPIEIVSYDTSWPGMFLDEERLIRRAIGAWLAGRIEHIGSTAIPGLGAKPVIDIMAAVESLDASRPAIEAASRAEYCYAPYRPDEEHWFCKPSPASRTHHLHLVPLDSLKWRATLAFRDYLRAHPLVAAEYEGLKRQLAKAHRTDREAYTAAKHPFIARIVSVAIDQGYGQ